MHIKLLQSDIVALLITRIRDNADKVKSGVYNNVDPTHFEKASCSFTLDYGFSHSELIDLEGNPVVDWEGKPIVGTVPDPEVVTAEYIDCTWGVDFIFKTSIGEIKAYWSRSGNDQGGEWCRVSPNFERAFKLLLDAPAVGKDHGWADDILAESIIGSIVTL